MFIDKKSLSVIHCASNDATRPMLNGIHFIKDDDLNAAVATDGKILAIVDNPQPDPMEHSKKVKYKQPFTLDSKDVKQLANTVKEAAREAPYPIGKNLAVQQKYNRITFQGIYDSELTLTAIRGKYPNFKQVIPKKRKKPVYVKLGRKVLESLVKTLKAFDAPSIMLEIETDGATSRCPYVPIVGKATSEDRTLNVVLMPIRN